MAFPDGTGFVIALPDGVERDWVRNVRTAGGCALVRRGQQLPLTAPQVVDQRTGLPLTPRLIQLALRLLGVTAFLQLRQQAASA